MQLVAKGREVLVERKGVRGETRTRVPTEKRGKREGKRTVGHFWGGVRENSEGETEFHKKASEPKPRNHSSPAR